jgi:hypothetical protein
MNAIQGSVNLNEPLKLYWQPGCTACLRMKEFFTRHHVDYVSINVLTDPAELDDLVKLAGRHIPIARRGDQWADGQVLSELARIGGIDLQAEAILSPAELARRASNVLDTTARLVGQIPESRRYDLLPDRPRTYMQLVAHIAHIVEAFVDEVEHGKRLEFAAYHQDVPSDVHSISDLIGFVVSVRERLDRWWAVNGTHADFARPANVYYGTQTLHQFLERTTWHSSQHTRQLALVVETIGLIPDRPLSPADLAGLPLPTHVWDDTLQFTATA